MQLPNENAAAKVDLMEGSVTQEGAVIAQDPADSIEQAKAEAAYNKHIHDARIENMAIIKRQIPRQLPYVLNANNMHFPIHSKINGRDEAISNLIYGPDYGEYSRSVPRSYEFVAYLGAQQGHHMVVYRMASDVSDDIYPATYYLATLTEEGEVIAQKKIASMDSPLKITTATIAEDGTITSQRVSQTWQYAPEKVGYAKNKVIKSEVIATENFRIGADGLISGT